MSKVHILPSGEKYEGDFVNGKKHGKGKSSYPDLTTYEGDYVNGKKHGYGRLHFNDQGFSERTY